MSQTFTCPKCGAPQDYQGGTAATIQCPYCETTLIVPPELRTTTPGASMSGAAWTRQANALLEIKRLLQSGNKLGAIKQYRETFGGRLEEAKNAVEAIERGQNVQVAQINLRDAVSSSGNIEITSSPQGIQITTPASRAGGTGCVTAIVVVVVLAVVASIVVPLLLAGMDLFNAFAPAAIPTRAALATVTRAPTATLAPTTTPTPGFASAVKTFSKKGTAPGQLNDARSIAVDNKGNVYVGEYSGARIQRFDTQGAFHDQWSGTSRQILQGLTTDVRGSLYAVINGVINKYDGATGKLVGQLKYPQSGDGFVSIAGTPDGGLVGMWYEGRNGLITSLEGHREYLVRFDREGQVTKVIKGIISNQTDDIELDNFLAVDSTGNLYILTSETEGAVFKFSPEGKLITRFGSRGSEPGQFDTAYSIATDSKGRVYIGKADGIAVFSADGRYLESFDNHRDDAQSMAFDAQDNLWVLSYDKITQFRLNK